MKKKLFYWALVCTLSLFVVQTRQIYLNEKITAITNHGKQRFSQIKGIAKNKQKNFYIKQPLPKQPENLFYLHPTHAILSTMSAPLVISYKGQKLRELATVDGAVLYLLPFPITDWLILEHDKENFILDVVQMETQNGQKITAIDEQGFYLRYDMSFICSQSLLKMQKGACHYDSYYVD